MSTERLENVLVVGGNQKSQGSLEGYLSEHGYSVQCASTIADADQRLADASFDLIITETQLPDGKGEALTECGIPVMALTLESTGPTDPISSRFAVHLSKPVPLDSLLDALREMIDESRQHHS